MNQLTAVTKPSRLILILHPNTECAAVVLNDRNFNQESFTFTRDVPAEGEEALLLHEIDQVIGITRVRASKNKLNLEIQACMRPNEWVPEVLASVFRWAGEDYQPAIEVADRRYVAGKEPRYDSDGWMTSPGVRTTEDLGFNFAYTRYVDTLGLFGSLAWYLYVT